jgi:hypothetical protein
MFEPMIRIRTRTPARQLCIDAQVRPSDTGLSRCSRKRAGSSEVAMGADWNPATTLKGSKLLTGVTVRILGIQMLEEIPRSLTQRIFEQMLELRGSKADAPNA